MPHLKPRQGESFPSFSPVTLINPNTTSDEDPISDRVRSTDQAVEDIKLQLQELHLCELRDAIKLEVPDGGAPSIIWLPIQVRHHTDAQRNPLLLQIFYRGAWVDKLPEVTCTLVHWD